jgi:starch synthase
MEISKLRVLFTTSEAYPLAKTGGLADVSYALPNALRQMGIDIRLLLPGYPAIFEQLPLIEVSDHLNLFSLPELQPIRLLVGFIDGTNPVYVIDCPKLYQRTGGPYQDEAGNEWRDNILRFGVLSKVAALFGGHHLLFKPDILHCNDWQTGLALAYLAHDQTPSRAKTLISVHNMAYQGIFGPELAELFYLPATDMFRAVELLGLPASSFDVQGLEFYGKMSFLKAGLYYADWITTVSPTYAKDIQTPQFGYGLQGLLSHRQRELTGILNGIDTEAWNPMTDAYLTSHYGTHNLANKAKNTQALRTQLGLTTNNERRPLLGMITRLTYQKGLDLLVPILPDIIRQGAQLVLLGSGDKELENKLLQLADDFPGQISINLGYDEALSHQIEAGADIFLMPSLFEPCGLNQMYSMHYGTVPIVRRTGGLADTVIDASPENLTLKTATGFVFEEEAPQQLFQCVKRALKTFSERSTWRMLQINGMNRDFSWHHSAQEYVSLYRHLLGC